MVEVPFRSWLFFVNDCHYYYSCYTHCALNFYYIDDYYSCNKGCDLFQTNKYCNCMDYNQSLNVYDYYDDDYFYYDDDYYTDDIMGDGSFDYHKCAYGCDYSLKQYVYPNYTVTREATGKNNNRIDTDNNINLDELLKIVATIINVLQFQ